MKLNNLNFISHTAAVIIASSPGYPRESSESLTPVQTFPPMYCLQSWNNREARADQYNQVFSIEEQH